MAVPNPTPIYHITHWSNLPDIVANDGLRCCTALRQRDIRYTDLANPEIQDIRGRVSVPLPPGGCLHDYVPFYFAPRSPMLFKINKGGHRYPERQTPIVHLASTVQAVYSANRPWVFTDGHAIMALSEFYTDLGALDRIDWPLMSSRYWADTQEDGDRCRRRQAEFLVHRQFPWELVAEIGVLNSQVAAQVLEVLDNAPHKPAVRICPGWYY
jgi:hypothetical protein